MKKRMLACLLVLCMVMTMAPTVAFAADDGLMTAEQQDVGESLPAGDVSDSNDGNDVESEGQTDLTTEESSQEQPAEEEAPVEEEIPAAEIELLAEPEAKEINTAEALRTALSSAKTNDTITLTGNITVNTVGSYDYAYFKIPAGVTVNGAGYTIDVAETVSNFDKQHVFEMAGGSKLENITLDGKNSKSVKSGVQVIYTNNTAAEMKNVTIRNFHNAGIILNGALLNATGLTMSGNAWGSINVDKKSGTEKPVLILKNSELKDKAQVYVECEDYEIHAEGYASYTISGISNKTYYSTDPSRLGAVVVENAPKARNAAEVDGVIYQTLEAAIQAAQDGDTVKLLKDVDVSAPTGNKFASALEIKNKITLDGNGHSITATGNWATSGGNGWDSDYGKYHLISVLSEGVTIQDVVLDAAGNARTALNIYNAKNVTLDKVTAKNADTFGVIAGGSEVVATNLTTEGNQWGVNVDGSSMDLSDSTINGDFAIQNDNNKTRNDVVIDNTILKNALKDESTKQDDKNASLVVSNSTIEGKITKSETGDMKIADSKITVTEDQTLPEGAVISGCKDQNDAAIEDAGVENVVAKINGVPYESVAAAIAAVKSGETITLVKDVLNANGIAVASGKNFTLDFAGHEYVLTDPGAGSTDTETNGFQLLKDSTIVFKNGTIRIAKNANNIKRMIQNYANLTLENMMFYAENQVGGEAYPLSFNNGEILFTGNTSIITTKDTTSAFDVCKFGEGDYYPSTKVTFDKDFTGTINGKIVYDAKDASTHTLTIEPNQGTLGEIVVAATGSSEAAKTAINVQGGNFTAPVNPEYLDASVKAELKHGDEKLYSYYSSVEDAVADMKDGDTVTNLENTTGSDPIPSYTLTLDAGKGETEWTSKTVPSGTKLVLPDASRSGYRFRGWEDENGKTVGYGGDTYTVEKDMTLTAQWKKRSSGGSSSDSSSSDDKFDIDKPSKIENGSISLSDKRAEKGDTVTITVKPDKGYVLDELTVFDEDGDKIKLTEKSENKFTFKMPAGDVEIEVSFKAEGAEWENRFTDISKNDYFYDAVEWAVKKEITSGITEELFAPHMACSRAQMVTFLWRAAGSPAVQNAVNPFADVAADAYYHDAVLWAVEQGITSGVSATSFAPDAAVTRGQTVTFLYRAAGKPAVSGTNAFADVAADAFYADAVQWAVSKDVTSGTSKTSFAPNDACTRGQIVTFLYRAK